MTYSRKKLLRFFVAHQARFRLRAACTITPGISVKGTILRSMPASAQLRGIPTTVANMSKYSILEQTGISALAQDNQMQQLVLKLLQ